MSKEVHRYRQIKIDLVLSVCLALLAILCHGRYLLSENLLFATEGDSFRQILPTNILMQNAFLSGNPFWSWNFGVGEDLFSQLSYAGSVSIFTWIQTLARKLLGETIERDLLSALRWKMAFSILRQILALELMYWMLRKERIQSGYAWIGAVTYGCAPWLMYRAIVFDFMTDAYALFPFVVLAYDRYRRNGKWGILVISTALMIGNNLYFGYICSLYLASIYLLFSIARFGNDQGTGNWLPMEVGMKNYAVRIVKLVIISILGFLIAGISFFPSWDAIRSADRAAVSSGFRLIPYADSFRTLFITLFGGEKMFAFPVCCLLAFFLKWRKMCGECRRRTVLSLFWVILFLIPATSSIMNGFSYETPRWIFIVIFSVAWALPWWLTELENGNGKITFRISLLLCLLIVIIYGFTATIERSIASIAWGTAFILGCLELLLVSSCGTRIVPLWIQRNRIGLHCAFAALAGILACTGVRVHNLYKDEALASFYGTENEILANQDLVCTKGEFYRVQDMGIEIHNQNMENKPYVTGVYGISNYASAIYGKLGRWMKHTMQIRTDPISPNQYQGFDDRLFLDLIWDIRYKIPVDERAEGLPTQWEHAQTESGADVLRSRLSIGFDCWYSTAISEMQWQTMSAAEKDAAMLQTAAVDRPVPQLPAPVLDSVTAEYALSNENARVKDGSWQVDGTLLVEEEGTLKWFVPEHPEGDGEFLLMLSLEELSGVSRFIVDAAGKRTVKYADRAESEVLCYPLTQYAFRFPGTSSEIELKLSRGRYRIIHPVLSFNSFSKVESWVTERNRVGLEGLEVCGNKICGTVTTKESGILSLSMINRPGWICWINGKRMKPLTVNGIFLGLLLNEGVSDVQMIYWPPMLLPGAIISLIGLVILTGVIIFERKNHRK